MIVKALSIGFAVVASLSGASSIARADQVTTIWGNSCCSSVLQEWDLNGNLLDTINPPFASNGRGVVQVGNILYYTEASSNGVYAYNFVTNTDLGTVFTVAGASGLATMAWDGSHFWIGDYSGTNNAYEYSTTGTLLKTVALANCSSYCDGLEYANGDLISNRYDGGEGGANTYDVYDTNGNLLKSALITGTDSSGNTGIAYDGTDYYVSNIYDQSISVFNSSGTWVRDFTLQTGGYGTEVEDLSVNYQQVLTPVPEPSTWAMMLLGFAGVGFAGYRASRKSVAIAA